MLDFNLHTGDLVLMDGACWEVTNTEVTTTTVPHGRYYHLCRVGDTQGGCMVPCQMLDRLVALGEATRYVDHIKAASRG